MDHKDTDPFRCLSLSSDEWNDYSCTTGGLFEDALGWCPRQMTSRALRLLKAADNSFNPEFFCLTGLFYHGTMFVPTMKPIITIEYCPKCGWMLRAAYFAQELLTTFQD